MELPKSKSLWNCFFFIWEKIVYNKKVERTFTRCPVETGPGPVLKPLEKPDSGVSRKIGPLVTFYEKNRVRVRFYRMPSFPNLSRSDIFSYSRLCYHIMFTLSLWFMFILIWLWLCCCRVSTLYSVYVLLSVCQPNANSHGFIQSSEFWMGFHIRIYSLLPIR